MFLAIEYAHRSNMKSMSSSLKPMVFTQHGKIIINLFGQVKRFVGASGDPGKQI